MGNIFVVRHGQTTHNAEGIIQGPRIDSHLSTLGLQQAAAVADALADVRLDAIVTSPLARARATADAVAARQHTAGRGPTVSLSVGAELYEVDYGTFSGQRYDDVRDDIAMILDAWQLGFVDQAFPGGESATLAQHRIRDIAARLQATEKNVAVIAHGRINRILLATLTGDGLTALETFPQDNANITELHVNGAVHVVRRNDTSHLDLGGGSSPGAFS